MVYLTMGCSIYSLDINSVHFIKVFIEHRITRVATYIKLMMLAYCMENLLSVHKYLER